MKTILILFVLALFVVNPVLGQSNSKKVETVEFKVFGLCGMCKERIENAALIKGVKLAEWNKETDVLKVIFNPQKVKLDDIQLSIVSAGHDTEKFKADDKVYQKLPKCCAYRDSNGKH